MNKPLQLCPQCQAKLITLEGGLVSCPNCSFEGDKWAKPLSPIWTSQRLFWISLVTPSLLALINLLLRQKSEYTLGEAIVAAIVALAVGGTASFYCARWLVLRFIKDGFMRIFLGLVVGAALLIVNFSIIAAGCSASPK